jgi:hypothetical protein
MFKRLSTWTAHLHSAGVTRLSTGLRRRRDRHTDDGGSIAEYAVITALVVALAILIVGIVGGKLTDLARSIQL